MRLTYWLALSPLLAAVFTPVSGERRPRSPKRRRASDVTALKSPRTSTALSTKGSPSTKFLTAFEQNPTVGTGATTMEKSLFSEIAEESLALSSQFTTAVTDTSVWAGRKVVAAPARALRFARAAALPTLIGAGQFTYDLTAECLSFGVDCVTGTASAVVWTAGAIADLPTMPRNAYRAVEVRTRPARRVVTSTATTVAAPFKAGYRASKWTAATVATAWKWTKVAGDVTAATVTGLEKFITLAPRTLRTAKYYTYDWVRGNNCRVRADAMPLANDPAKGGALGPAKIQEKKFYVTESEDDTSLSFTNFDKDWTVYTLSRKGALCRRGVQPGDRLLAMQFNGKWWRLPKTRGLLSPIHRLRMRTFGPPQKYLFELSAERKENFLMSALNQLP